MLGIVVDNVINTPSQYLMFTALNEISKTHNCYVFAGKVIQLPQKPRFAIMQQVEAFGHRGVLIGTSILSSQIVEKALMASRKYYYLWSLEWMGLDGFDESQLDNIYCSDEMQLIARSSTHYNKISQYFKPPSHIIYNWNTSSLLEILNHDILATA